MYKIPRWVIKATLVGLNYAICFPIFRQCALNFQKQPIHWFLRPSKLHYCANDVCPCWVKIWVMGPPLSIVVNPSNVLLNWFQFGRVGMPLNPINGSNVFGNGIFTPSGRDNDSVRVISHSLSLYLALAMLAGQVRAPQSQQTHEMTIPNELIGCIIGKGGSKVAEIRYFFNL